MNVEIDYAIALARHPVEVQVCIDKIRKGKAKKKDTDPATWKWTYDWATSVEGFSLGDMLSGKAQKPPKPQTVEERVADEVSRSSACLQARIGGTWSYSPLSVFPEEATAVILKAEQQAEADRRQWESLSDEGRKDKLEGLLKQLRGPGFVEIKL